MSIEGQIHIQLDPGSSAAVSISSSRPRQLLQLLQGLEPQALQQKIPLLYALCGKAQWLAATRALQAVSSDTALPDHLTVTPRQQRAVVVEALQEYLWRFLMDLPQRLHKQPFLSVFAPLRKALGQLAIEPEGSDEIPCLLAKLDETLRIELLGMTAERWLTLDIAGWDHWLNQYSVVLPTWLRELRMQLQQSPSILAGDLLPGEPTSEQLQTLGQALGSDIEFAFSPEWNGQHPETGALSYQQQQPWLVALQQRGSSPVLLRMLARLFEVLRLREGLHRSFAGSVTDGELDALATGNSGWMAELSGSVRLQPQIGLGWVRTARGLLLHWVQLDQGKVSDYRILAPTEWNFHRHGALALGLQSWLWLAPEQLHDWVGLQVLSLDPCVQYQFQVSA